MFSLKFMVISDMLKNAPMFKKLDARIKVVNLRICSMAIL